jgi:hypothetical protein
MSANPDFTKCSSANDRERIEVLDGDLLAPVENQKCVKLTFVDLVLPPYA